MLPERFANYTLHERLNEGGMADVFYAVSPQGTVVAIRRLKPEFKFSLSKRSDFQRGMEIQMEMRGPHIVHVHELNSYKMLPYAAMEYIKGVNLRQALVRRMDYIKDWGQAFIMFEKIVKGIGEVHRSGSMHLDVKPENIMLSQTGEIKILDFDLATRIPKQPKPLSTIDGTPSYIAPEVILKEPADERADIFALGILAYELFTGQKPFVGKDKQEVFRNHTSLNTPFHPATAINPALPHGLAQIIHRCAEKRFDQRYPSVALILRDLRTLRAPIPQSIPAEGI